MASKYPFSEIEPKWQQIWEETKPFTAVDDDTSRPKYYILDMFKEALTAFDYAVLIDENFIGGYLEKAKTLEELSRYEEATANYKVTLDLDDPTAFAFVRIGNCYQMLNDYDAALQFYKKAVNEDPLLDKAWIALTDIYFQLQNFEKALYYIEKAIKIVESKSLSVSARSSDVLAQALAALGRANLAASFLPDAHCYKALRRVF